MILPYVVIYDSYNHDLRLFALNFRLEKNVRNCTTIFLSIWRNTITFATTPLFGILADAKPKSFIHRFERDWFWCSWDATRFQKLRCLPKHNWRLKHKDMRRHSFHSKGSVWSWGCIQSMFLLQISISLWHTDKHFHMSSLTEITQCGNFKIFLSLRFYVKSDSGILKVQNCHFL